MKVICNTAWQSACMSIVLSIHLSVCLPLCLCICLSCPGNKSKIHHRIYLYLPTKACQYVLINFTKPDIEKNVSKKYGEPPIFFPILYIVCPPFEKRGTRILKISKGGSLKKALDAGKANWGRDF